MRILDRYVARNFIVGYLITTFVLIGLCTLIDLFVNLDEFAEHAEKGTGFVLANIYDYYKVQSTLWFRDLAGVITIVAAVFSLGRMTYANELIAIMASGVSLKRVIVPIVLLSLVSMGLLVLDQELVIPRLAHKLIRSHDYDPASESVHYVWFMPDRNNSLICTRKYEKGAMIHPTILKRRPIPGTAGQFEVVDVIQADRAVWDDPRGGWVLENGRYWGTFEQAQRQVAGEARTVDFYATDLTPDLIPLRQQEGYKALLSYRQLLALEEQAQRIRDVAELYVQKHARITAPIINMVMLLLALPVLVVRDPKVLKSAILKAFSLVILCFSVATLCRMFAAEEIFGRVLPEVWTWAPIILFVPVAFMELDAMKT
ncbi:MAG TPA: LptF/LptG family permease [Phycisphaerales bacterium]|nr:LptF/LptG family permease [Phycisphaerales bacterium]